MIRKEESGGFSLAWDLRDRANGPSESDGGLSYLSDHQRSTIHCLITLQQMLAVALSRSREGPGFCIVEKQLPEVTRTLGAHIFRFLFGQECMRNGLRMAKERLSTEPGRHFLRVIIDLSKARDRQVESWPWEYLYDEDLLFMPEAGFLAHYSRLILHRRKSINWNRDQSFSVPKPVVLLVVSGPRNKGPVNPEPLVHALRDLQRRELIELKELVQAPWEEVDDATPREEPSARIVADFESFKRALRAPVPDVIHFVGHGLTLENGSSALAFMNPNTGDARPIGGKEFAQEIGKSSTKRLVILQACESALADPNTAMSSVAQELVMENVYAVVGMQHRITNEEGADFAVKFYEELAEGSPVDVAVKAGRDALQVREASVGSARFGTKPTAPVLYLYAASPLFVRETSKTRATVVVDTVETQECPRCHARTQEVCPKCGLRLQCARCERKYLDPLSDKFCSKCAEGLEQKPYPPEGPGSAGATPASQQPQMRVKETELLPSPDIYRAKTKRKLS